MANCSYQKKFSWLGRGIISIAALLTLIISLSGCGEAATSSSGSDNNSPVSVWVDSTRLPAVQLYQKEHPKVHLKISTVDRTTLPDKILLFNRTGNGWPDVVFAEPIIVSRLADKVHHYPADLNQYVSKNILDNFAAGANAPCTINGKLYCLRNDLAQDVLWYNSKLMTQFRYNVPTTWEDYQALGLRVAKEHPGYVVGTFGDSSAFYSYFYASSCPTNQIIDTDKVLINTADPKCTRIASLLDPLLAAGSVTRLSPFDAAFAKIGTQNKILMMPEASWFGEYVFKPSYKTPDGELQAAPPLRWSSEPTAVTGAHGGAAWAMSSHAKNVKAAVDLVVWLSTSNDYQATAPTFPAYLPAADKWQETLASDKMYTVNPYPVMKQAASLIDPKWSSVRYDVDGIFNSVMASAVLKKQTIASALPTLQTQLVQVAQISGYTVVMS